MRRLLLLPLVTALFGLGSFESVMAQSTGRSGSGASGGTSGRSSSSFGGASAGARTGGVGGQAASGAEMATTASGLGSGVLPSEGVSQSGFVGLGNVNTFAGNQNASQQTVSAGTTSRFSAFGNNLGTITPPPSAQARGNQMRISQTVAFGTSPIPPQTIQASLQSHFTTLTNRLPGVSAQVDATGLVTLEGQVVDADTARLAEALALIEPGVLRVQNNLVVPAAPAPLPTLP